MTLIVLTISHPMYFLSFFLSPKAVLVYLLGLILHIIIIFISNCLWWSSLHIASL